MVSYTFYTKADLWSGNCQGKLVNIVVFNGFGNIVIKAPRLDPTFSGEVTICLDGMGLVLKLRSGVASYIISDERHQPQDSTEKMYKKLAGA
jgi:hypothetical protein